METVEVPFSLDQIDPSDTEGRDAFVKALIERSAEKVREQRLKAFHDGLIDEHGYAVDRSLLSEADSRLSVEQ